MPKGARINEASYRRPPYGLQVPGVCGPLPGVSLEVSSTRWGIRGESLLQGAHTKRPVLPKRRPGLMAVARAV